MTEPVPPLSIILTVTNGPCRGTAAPLRGMQAVLGRDTDCTLCLDNDSTVSRRHASLSWERGQWFLRDLGSKNGTFIQTESGAVRLEGPHVITPGDTFLAGSAAISVEAAPAPPDAAPVKLRILLSGNRLTYELETGAAIATRAELAYAGAETDALQRARLALIAREQGGGAAIEEEFLAAGRQLAHVLLPPAILEGLRHLERRPLGLVLDPQLIGIAWESLVIGEGLLCMTRPMARRILLEVPARPPRANGRRFLVVANPSGDLAFAQEHGESLFEQLTHEFALPEVTFLAGRRATQRSVCAALEQCDALIYLGHAAHDPAAPRQSGWRLADGMLDVERLAGLASVPALVVAAACESARETPATAGFSLLPEGTGVAAGLMLAGVEQYVGTLWRMPVVSGTAFGAVLLRALLDGAAMGDAMMTAREHLREVLRAPGYVCAGQVHYGNHDWRLRR